MLFFNAHHEPVEFHVPERCGGDWRKVLDTSVPTSEGELPNAEVGAGATVTVIGRAVVMLEQGTADGADSLRAALASAPTS